MQKRKKKIPQNRFQAQVASSDLYQTFKVEVDAHLLTLFQRAERMHLVLPSSDQENTGLTPATDIREQGNYRQNCPECWRQNPKLDISHLNLEVFRKEGSWDFLTAFPSLDVDCCVFGCCLGERRDNAIALEE